MVKPLKIIVFSHPKQCENCRHAIKKASSFTDSYSFPGMSYGDFFGYGKYLCKAGGMVREPQLPLLWIYTFGCSQFE